MAIPMHEVNSLNLVSFYFWNSVRTNLVDRLIFVYMIYWRPLQTSVKVHF